MSKNHILYAYCREQKECIHVDDVRAAFFRSGEGLQKFTFECADEICRAENHPEMLAPNHNKFGKVAPYFKSLRKDEHIPECTVCKYSDAIETVMQNKRYYSKMTSRNLVRDFKSISSASVYDEFSIRDEPERARANFAQEIVQTKDDPIKAVLCGKTTTHSLRNLIECYFQLKGIRQLETPLRIEGHNLTFQKAFKTIIYLERWFTFPHVYFSSAIVQEDGTTIKIFGRKINSYLGDKQQIGSVILLDYEDIKKHRQLRNDIDTVISNRDQQFEFYVMGRHELRNLSITKDGEKNWVVIEPISYHALVIRLEDGKEENMTT